VETAQLREEGGERIGRHWDRDPSTLVGVPLAPQD